MKKISTQLISLWMKYRELEISVKFAHIKRKEFKTSDLKLRTGVVDRGE